MVVETNTIRGADLDRWVAALSTVEAENLLDRDERYSAIWQRAYFDPLSVFADWLADAGAEEEEDVVRFLLKHKIMPDLSSTSAPQYEGYRGRWGFYWWETRNWEHSQLPGFSKAFPLLTGRKGGSGIIPACRRYETLGESVIDLVLCVAQVRREEKRLGKQAEHSKEVEGASDRPGGSTPEEDGGGQSR